MRSGGGANHRLGLRPGRLELLLHLGDALLDRGAVGRLGQCGQVLLVVVERLVRMVPEAARLPEVEQVLRLRPQRIARLELLDRRVVLPRFVVRDRGIVVALRVGALGGRLGVNRTRGHQHRDHRPRAVRPPAVLPETHEVTRRYLKVPGAAMP